jgi:hypothetical protein
MLFGAAEERSTISRWVVGITRVLVWSYGVGVGARRDVRQC